MKAYEQQTCTTAIGCMQNCNVLDFEAQISYGKGRFCENCYTHIQCKDLYAFMEVVSLHTQELATAAQSELPPN